MEGQHEGRDKPKEGESVKTGDQGKMVGAPVYTESRFESSAPQFETVDGSYHFTLTGYSLAKGVGSGKYFSSGAFAVGGHEWAIYFYPDGKSDSDQSEFVSVFIVLTSESFNVQALFEIALIDRSGRGKHKIHSHFNGHIKSPYTLECQGAMWGYKRYFRRAALDKSVFLKDDTLEFKGRVGVLLSSIKLTKLITNTVSPQHHQSTGDDESTSENVEATDSQSEDGFVSKSKVLRLEDELARYHLKLLNSQSPIKGCETTEVDKHPSALVESTVA